MLYTNRRILYLLYYLLYLTKITHYKHLQMEIQNASGNEVHYLAPLWRLCGFGAVSNKMSILAYILTYVYQPVWIQCRICCT